MKKFLPLLVLLPLFIPHSGYGEQILTSFPILLSPVIDGKADDPQWRQATGITTHDPVADIAITINAVHTATNLYLLVTFPDPDESRLHKPWLWDNEQQRYLMGPQREDTLVFKWPLDPNVTDFSLTTDVPYEADIWFWKADRTDPAGFADDKIQILSDTPRPKAMLLQSASGLPMYLQRKGDKGTAAYRSVLYLDREKAMMPQFQSQRPTGSRADILAKGAWKDGGWTLELTRPLQTQKSDDIQFELEGSYPFGVSRYEIAGRKPDSSLSQPLYGCGDVSERLILQFRP